MKKFPFLAITMGDPAGIGPEVALKALLDDELRASARWVLVGEAWQISELGRELGFHADQIVTSLEDDDGEGQEWWCWMQGNWNLTS